VAKLAGIVVIPRPGSDTRDLPAGATVLDIAPMDVSASGVRAAVRRGDGGAVDTMVPAGVARYIHDHGLYRTGA
jgi:nicotinic acid mononucleotide adenylyltransferase